MRIGIIGAGSLGTALGARLAGAGHSVLYGGGAAAHEAAAAQHALAGTNADAAGFGEVVVLAVPFAAVEQALASAAPLAGRVLWSCVNALKPDMSGLAVGFDTSAAERVAAHAAGARVVAAIPPFAQALAGGELAYDGGLPPTVFMCGDDGGAKATIATLITDIGAQPVDSGPLSAARLVEPAMMLAVSIAYAGVPRDVSLRLLERRAA
jgi:predicted dinucleotide-binding enzyme